MNSKEFDFSVFDINQHYFEFGNMTLAEIEAKKKEWEEHQKNKVAAAPGPSTVASSSSAPKPVFKPRIKPPTPPTTTE